MLVTQRPWRQGAFQFTGSSWMMSNILQFTPQEVGEPTGEWIHGVSLEPFGGPRWWAGDRKSASLWVDEVPEVVIEACRSGSCAVLFDMSNEGQIFMPEWMTCLHDEMTARGLPAERCTLLQQNRIFEHAYRLWANASGLAPMKIGIYDHFPRRLIGTWDQSEAVSALGSHLRTKHYCCLNFTPRAPRVGLVSWLLAGGFDALGYISFATGQKDATIPANLETYEWFPEIETVHRGLEMLRARVPLLLDLQAETSDIPEYDLGPEFAYHESYFSIVTESDVSDGDLIRMTEKSLKPMLMSHPFIVVGNPGTLRLLQDLGFETFPEMFDERYDLVKNPVARIRLIMEELVRILAFPIASLHETYLRMRLKLHRNNIRARYLLSTQYAMVTEPSLIDSILANERA